MKKLIDPVHIIEKLAQRCLSAKGLECCVLGEVIDLLKATPAVDAVEVTRCRDCKHFKYTVCGIGECGCTRFHIPGHPDPTMRPDDFCSCGERR